MGAKPAAVFLCDKTGIAARPWAGAGVECWCVDIEHSIRRDRVDGNINFVWGDVRTWRPPSSRRIIFVGAFPPCTHVAVSGARDFAKKRGMMLRDALETFEASCQAVAWSGAPGFVENPVAVWASIPHIGAPDYWFHPSDYAGYLADHSTDAYTKKTGLHTFNGFVMPPRKPVDPIDGSRMHLLPPSDDRADLRAATPAGFAMANFLANCPEEYRKATLAPPGSRVVPEGGVDAETVFAECKRLRGTLEYIAAQAKQGYPTVLSVIRANAEAALNDGWQETVAAALRALAEAKP